MMSCTYNPKPQKTLKYRLNNLKKLGTGHFLKDEGLMYQKKTKLVYPEKMQKTTHLVPVAAPLVSFMHEKEDKYHFTSVNVKGMVF